MGDQIIRATRRSTDKVEFVFMRPSMPSSEDEVIDGNNSEGVQDANDQT
mgnify:CR=1 FL=1